MFFVLCSSTLVDEKNKKNELTTQPKDKILFYGNQPNNFAKILYSDCDFQMLVENLFFKLKNQKSNQFSFEIAFIENQLSLRVDFLIPEIKDIEDKREIIFEALSKYLVQHQNISNVLIYANNEEVCKAVYDICMRSPSGNYVSCYIAYMICKASGSPSPNDKGGDSGGGGGDSDW